MTRMLLANNRTEKCDKFYEKNVYIVCIIKYFLI